MSPPVIHRDIKPKNVFVKGGACVLGDFGLMKQSAERDDDTREAIFKRSVGWGMPFFYRTPDQVAYARNQSDLTIASDVFQLGLFGWRSYSQDGIRRNELNTTRFCRMSSSRTSAIRGLSGVFITNLIRDMLVFDPVKRPSAGMLLESWQGVFFNAAKQELVKKKRVL